MRVSRPTVVRTLEHSRVSLPDPWNTASTRERLEQAALKAGFRAFEIRGHQLHTLGVVGVVDLGGLIVEILPKTHEDCTSDQAAIFLSELLRFGGVLDRLSVVDARTAVGERTLLEIVLAWAAREAAANIREGLPRRYEQREEESMAVRGRIELRQLARRPPGKDFQLVVRYAPLDENNPLTRIVRWLLQEIASRTRLVATQRLCRRLLQELDGIGSSVPTLMEIDRLALQPSETRWRPLIELSGMLLRQMSPNPGRAGTHDAVAVLFRLHDLFEAVLRKVFREGLPARGLALRRPDRHLLEAFRPAGKRLMPLKPDFVFVLNGDRLPVLLGDAKWKRILDSSAGFSLREADAYQMTTYLAVYGPSAGFIFCPLSAVPTESHLVTAVFRIQGQGTTLHVTGIHLPTLIAATPLGKTAREALCTHVAELVPA